MIPQQVIDNSGEVLFKSSGKPLSVYTKTAYGLDLSIRHGSLVKVSWCYHRDFKQLDIRHIYRLGVWGKVNFCKPPYHGIGLDATLLERSFFAAQVAHLIPGSEKVFTDWIPSGGFRSNIKLGTMIAYIYGYIGGLLHERSSSLEFLGPSTLRSMIGVIPKGEKLLVHYQIRKLLERSGSQAAEWFMAETSEDTLDAVCLAISPSYQYMF